MATSHKNKYLSYCKYEQIKYNSFTLNNYKRIPQIQKLSSQQLFEIDVVGHVFPFKTNNYVVNVLINWNDVPNDPIFRLNFPQKNMLKPHHFEEMARMLRKSADKAKILKTANKIRFQLNPHPAGQMKRNIPHLDGRKLHGVQHKYEHTVLFFPNQGQTCHAYCTFCFRWPQFVGINQLKFAMQESNLLVAYLREHCEVTDVLITGGDPLVMKSTVLSRYIEPLLEANLSNLQTIRLGTKSLSFWPYKFLVGREAEETLNLFRRIVQSGKHLALMAHFTHPRELKNPAVLKAIKRIRMTGAVIRTQSPILRHINDTPQVWVDMWQTQVQLGCIPYYMFVVRDTGAQHFFEIPLVKAWRIFKAAYEKVSGLARTVRGPSMSTDPGKIQITGINEIDGQKVFVLNMLQARNSDLVRRTFFADFDAKAMWLDDLKPAFGKEKFLFE
ncbi:MAG: KamA family radical SAM protein [bacterium]